MREKPLRAFERVTVALAITAPEGSVTVPPTVPAFPAVWTWAGTVVVRGVAGWGWVVF